MEDCWNNDCLTSGGGGGGFGYGGLFGGDGMGYCPPAYANCDDSPFGAIGIAIVYGGRPHGDGGSPSPSAPSGASPNAPHIGGTYPNGETSGIPNGVPLQGLTIWQLLNLSPLGGGCDFGVCPPIGNGIAAAGAVPVCVLAPEACILVGVAATIYVVAEFGPPIVQRIRSRSKSRPRTQEKDCAKEWQDAREYCRELLSKPNPPRGLTGGYTDIENCARGFVSERCGGNRIDWGRLVPNDDPVMNFTEDAVASVHCEPATAMSQGN